MPRVAAAFAAIYPCQIVQISPGTRLGPYEIVGVIGAGGMGEVWRAKDLRLEREVAIKVLPAGLAERTQRPIHVFLNWAPELFDRK